MASSSNIYPSSLFIYIIHIYFSTSIYLLFLSPEGAKVEFNRVDSKSPQMPGMTSSKLVILDYPTSGKGQESGPGLGLGNRNRNLGPHS